MDSLFFEIGAIIVLAAMLSFIAFALRQPLTLAYIMTGMLAGASVLGIAHSTETFEALSQIGVAFLLFTVGLGLNWRHMRDVGRVALFAGVGQVLLTTLMGYPIARALDFDVTSSWFIAIAFAFSSTIIIVKLLADKEDLDTLYGRISLAILLIQDVLAMVVLLVIGALRTGDSLGTILAVSLVKGTLAILFLSALSAWVIPRIVRYAARSQELLMLVSISWCFLIAALLTAAGFGIEIGALLAGISFAGTAFQREILARVRHLRDFFLIIFFIVLGTSLHLSRLNHLLVPIILFSIFILLVKPLIVLVITRLMHYHPRTGWLAGTTFAQVSEFSFIVLAAGAALGLVQEDALVLAAAVGVITIAVSTYLIEFNQSLYRFLQPLLRRWEFGMEGYRKPRASVDIVLLGYHRMGQVMLPTLQRLGKRLLVIDNDPKVIAELQEKKINVLYGDAADEECLSEAQIQDAKMIVSTIPDSAVTTSILEYLRRNDSKTLAVVTMNDESSALEAYDLGAQYVIVPKTLGGEKFTELLLERRLVKRRWAVSDGI